MKSSLVLILCLWKIFLFSQHNINGVVTYEQIESGQKTNVQMFFSSEKSFYVSNRGSESKIIKLGNGETLDMLDKNKGMAQLLRCNIIYQYYLDEEGDIIYSNWKNDSMIFRKVLRHDPVIVVEPHLPKIDWEIKRESKKISNFLCFKAITQFRGRKYEAWFAPEIPIPAGPWKLHGLPGLILEAQDSTTNYKYSFQTINIPSDVNEELRKLPRTGEMVLPANYRSVWLKKEEEHVRKVMSKAAARGSIVNMIPGEFPKQELNFD